MLIIALFTCCTNLYSIVINNNKNTKITPATLFFSIVVKEILLLFDIMLLISYLLMSLKNRKAD